MSGYIHNPEEWAATCVNDPRWLADCLQRIGRFGGQHPTANVLMHSLDVWWMCRHESPETQLWALYHDAHEVLTGDVARQYKSIRIGEIQDRLDCILLRHLGGIRPDMVTVDRFDSMCGDAEHSQWAETIWFHSNGHAATAPHAFEIKVRSLMAVVAATAKVAQ